MRTSTQIFRHSPRMGGGKFQPRQEGHSYDISEAVYEIFRETTTVAYQAAQRAYPRAKREQDENIQAAYDAAHEEAKSYLTHYKTLVRDAMLPLMRLTKHSTPYDFYPSDFELDTGGNPKTRKYEDRPTWQMRGMIVLNAYRMLHFKLVNWVPPMPEEERERYISMLNATYQDGRNRLLEFLSFYEADPILPEDGSHINIIE